MRRSAVRGCDRYDISERQRFVSCHHPQLSVYIRAAEGKLMHLDAVDEGHSDMGAAGDVSRGAVQRLGGK
jgi:glycerol kinase